MSAIKEKLAALRAKRASKSTPALPVHSAHLHRDAPHASWDADYKVRLQRHVPASKRSKTQLSPCSSEDEDEDELIVLPPPTRKLSSVAHRQLWRTHEMERAKEKNLRRLMESRPEAFQNTDPCSSGLSPHEEEEAEAEGDERDGNGEDEQGWEDEEEAALQSAGSLECKAEDEDEAGAQDGDNSEHVGEVGSVTDIAIAADGDKRYKHGEDPYLAPATSGGSSHEVERDITTDLSVKDRNGDICADDDPASIHASDNPKERALPQVTPPIEDESAPIVRKKSAITISKDPDTCNHPPPGLDFIEDEAEDENADGGEDLSAIPDRDDFMSSGVDSTDESVDENEISASEKKKLAAFHQKWLLRKEKEEVTVLKADPRKLLDLEDDEPSEKAGHASCTLANAVFAKDQDDTSQAAEESVFADLDCNNSSRPSNYIETMFLRDNSRSRFVQEEAEKADDDGISRRDKARALWKTRQKIKKDLFQEGENSLSRFDIFGDVDKSRGSLFRAQLEGACRPTSLKIAEERSKKGLAGDQSGNQLKRTFPWSCGAVTSEWERRNIVLAEKERKRQRSVSISRWSFAAHGEKQVVTSKTMRVSSSSVERISIAATYKPAKSRSRLSNPNPSRSSLRSGAKPTGRRPSTSRTSRRGLLDILGDRAVTDDL